MYFIEEKSQFWRVSTLFFQLSRKEPVSTLASTLNLVTPFLSNIIMLYTLKTSYDPINIFARNTVNFLSFCWLVFYSKILEVLNIANTEYADQTAH